MAKVLTEQVRLWPASGDDSSTKVFGDGSPLHASIGFDFFRNVNNLQTYVEPCFQFAFDAGGQSHQVRWTQTGSLAGSGEAFLGQLPLVIPHDAVRLCWTVGLRRRPGSAEAPIAVDVTGLHFFLAPGPCVSIDDDVMLDRTNFTFFAERTISLSETSGGPAAQGIYKLVNDTNPGWTGAIESIPGIQDVTQAPVVWGVFTADISGAATTGEDVELDEFSFWGAYE